jgi:non-canonical (house-cleaning) NTP pyrophosphatase
VAAKLFGGRGGYELFTCSDVKSGVSEQPMSAGECLKGATNRANAARTYQGASHDYGVGIEGGLEEATKGLWLESGWMVVVDREGRKGVSAEVYVDREGRKGVSA